MKNYDVVIIGGGTSGCACAWMAAKLGLKTLLVEKNSYLGGAMTAQLVVPAMKTSQNGLNTEFFDKLIKCSFAQNAQITYSDGNEGWFNPLKLGSILLEMLEASSVEVLLNSSVSEIEETKYIDSNYSDKNTQEQKIISLYIDTNYIDKIEEDNCIDKKHNDNTINIKNTKKVKIFSKYFVDATGDANLCALSGAKFLPFEKNQAMSLRFIMSGVDKNAFAQWLLDVDSNRNVTTAYETNGDIHLSTACTWDLAPNWALKPLFDKAVDAGELKDADRAYFQVFSVAGEPDKIAFNCPRIVMDKDLNPLIPEDIKAAKSHAVPVIERLARFCIKYFKGFENAKVYKIADALGIRESRRVKGKYVLTKEDIYNAREFKSPVAYSNYPIDIHSVKKDDFVLDYVQKVYTVPLESLIVDGFENLFVIGRCLSADFYAQAAVRIQPTCFAMGVGLAKYLVTKCKNSNKN